MRLSDLVGSSLEVGRLIALAAAALAIGLMAWWGYDLLRYAVFYRDPTWDEVGVIPFVVVLRIAVAVWVAWGAIRLGGGPLARTLLAAFGISFFLLYGWYFLLTGMDWGFLYWVVAGDSLYLAGALAIGCALLLSGSETRSGNIRA
jgi:hypothetical protein